MTVQQVTDIAASSQELARGTRRVQDVMQSITGVVEANTVATTAMASQAGMVTLTIHSIAAVSEEQSAATEQVSASTEEMSAQVAGMNVQARELAAPAANLRNLVGRFQLETVAALPDEFSIRRAA